MENTYPFSTVLSHDFSAGKFTILVLPSCLAEPGNAAEVASVIDAQIERTKPRLVFFAGDVTRGLADENALRAVLDVVLAPILTRNLPFAHVFGDTDSAAGLSNETAMAVYRSYPGCLSVPGDADIDGCGNYTLAILDAAERSPIAWLCMLDSHSAIHAYERKYGKPDADGAYPCARLPQPLYGKYYMDGIHFCQTMYYCRASREIERVYGEKQPAVLFFHMPPPEFSLVVMNQGNCRVTGIQREAVRTQVVNGGIFASALDRGDVRAIYAAHSAVNNWYGTFGGVRVGQMMDLSTENSATVVSIDADGTVSEAYSTIV